MQLQEVPSQFFIRALKLFKLSADFTFGGKEFHILGAKLPRLFVPNLTWLVLGTFKFSLYFSRTGLFDSRS